MKPSQQPEQTPDSATGILISRGRIGRYAYCIPGLARADLMGTLLGADVPVAAQAECVADHMISILGISSAVAYDQGGNGAPNDSQVSATEKTARQACPGS